ncbi:aldose 1-epimerase [Cohnella suwonensis]|uniref:Aldose 1-epimerase n=1 Tax=Cohnella suwonensis TaxID=696072 RepID=A0ABW0LXB0_9BACL
MSRYAVERVESEAYPVFRLRDEACGAVADIAPGVGNNLIRFEIGGRNVISSPPSVRALKHETFGAFRSGVPILFPPNRVDQGQFDFNGRTYRLPINEPPNYHLHGEICAKAWEVLNVSANEEEGASVVCRFRFAADPDILAYFPHELTFTVACRLHECELHLGGDIRNEGREEAPFGFGLHPYFSVPFGDGERIELTVPATAEWPVTDEAFATGEPSVTAFSERLNEGADISDYPLLGCSMLSLAEGGAECRIRMQRGGYTIRYRVGPEFPYLLLFRPDWSAAFSLEPYTCVTDAFNLPYAPETTGAKGIKPGQTISFATSIAVAAE